MKKVLVSIVLIAVMVSSMFATAYASMSMTFVSGINTDAEGGVEQVISDIEGIVAEINEDKAEGEVSSSLIEDLGNEIFDLVKFSADDSLTSDDKADIQETIDSAEKAIEGLADDDHVIYSAIKAVKSAFGFSGNGDAVMLYSENGVLTIVGDDTDSAEEYVSSAPYEDNLAPLPVGYGTSVVGTEVVYSNLGDGSGEEEQTIDGFTDVTPDDWYYNQVMAMTAKGLFKGKGNNMFCPNDHMTKSEFVAVVVRALYPDADLTAKSGEEWWRPVYNLASEKGLIRGNDSPMLSAKTINKNETITISDDVLFDNAIPRQEMAEISVKALGVLGETSLEPYTYILDERNIGTAYKESVRQAYGAGILIGDDKGFFNPQNTLTRAEASTVLYRIIEKSARATVDFSTYSPITIYEAQPRYNRNAKEGDTFVKADGTRIVLKKGPHGIVGEGQGVAADVGLNLGWGTAGYDTFSYMPDIYGSMFDSTGANLSLQEYRVNLTTGEGYWTEELQVLAEAYPEPEYEGSYDGQLSTDSYKLWNWASGMWFYNFGSYSSYKGTNTSDGPVISDPLGWMDLGDE